MKHKWRTLRFGHSTGPANSKLKRKRSGAALRAFSGANCHGNCVRSNPTSQEDGQMLQCALHQMPIPDTKAVVPHCHPATTVLVCPAVFDLKAGPAVTRGKHC